LRGSASVGSRGGRGSRVCRTWQSRSRRWRRSAAAGLAAHGVASRSERGTGASALVNAWRADLSLFLSFEKKELRALRVTCGVSAAGAPFALNIRMLGRQVLQCAFGGGDPASREAVRDAPGIFVGKHRGSGGAGGPTADEFGEGGWPGGGLYARAAEVRHFGLTLFKNAVNFSGVGLSVAPPPCFLCLVAGLVGGPRRTPRPPPPPRRRLGTPPRFLRGRPNAT
jgi:hypothetical protein